MVQGHDKYRHSLATCSRLFLEHVQNPFCCEFTTDMTAEAQLSPDQIKAHVA